MTPAQAIERQFPGVLAWYGVYTERWWALLWGGRWQLLEAATSDQLAQKIEAARRWPSAPRAESAGRVSW
jgi:hypothetical protein